MGSNTAMAKDRGRDELGLRQLREETLGFVQVGAVLLVVGVLIYSANRFDIVRSDKWLVLLSVLGAVGLSRLRWLSVEVASVVLIAGLGLSVVLATVLFPSGQLAYVLVLVVIIASVLTGDLPTFATAALTSAAVLALASWQPGAVADEAIGTVLLLIWAAAFACCLGSRSTHTALDWAWSSYVLLLDRTEELKHRQGELGRVAKSLNEACAQLEGMNGELERARRAAEAARQLKAEFAATISHELRTPLNLIIGFAEMAASAARVRNGRGAATVREGLEAIRRSADYLSRLVDDVLDLSQIEARRMALDRRWVTLREIVEDAVATMTPFYSHVGLGITVEVPGDLPPVYVDANRVCQILVNLLGNAARYTTRGQVTVRASCRESDIVLAVADTGDGIAPEDLPYIFDEFRQVGPADRRRVGSGLGLAICKRFAEMHGGYIWVESQLGQGSTFYVALPRCDNVVSLPVSTMPSVAPSAEATIAVLEPELDVSKVLQRYLDGYHVVWARDTAELGELVTMVPLRAVVLRNLSLDAWTELGAADARLRELPVVTCPLTTAANLREELSVADYLVKPVTQERLATALRRHAAQARKVLIVMEVLCELECGRCSAGL